MLYTTLLLEIYLDSSVNDISIMTRLLEQNVFYLFDYNFNLADGVYWRDNIYLIKTKETYVFYKIKLPDSQLSKIFKLKIIYICAYINFYQWY